MEFYSLSTFFQGMHLKVLSTVILFRRQCVEWFFLAHKPKQHGIRNRRSTELDSQSSQIIYKMEKKQKQLLITGLHKMDKKTHLLAWAVGRAIKAKLQVTTNLQITIWLFNI